MSNPVSFINAYTANIVKLTDALEDLRTQNDMIVQDPTLITRYFATPPMPNGQPAIRTDIVAADVENAQASIVQMLLPAFAVCRRNRIFLPSGEKRA